MDYGDLFVLWDDIVQFDGYLSLNCLLVDLEFNNNVVIGVFMKVIFCKEYGLVDMLVIEDV